MNEEYTVRKGDTLTRIAAAFGVSKHDLAKLNKIHNQNMIREGQVLQIPPKVVELAPLEPLQIDLSSLLSLQFLDAANKPIEGMEVSVCVAGEVEKHKTDTTGKVPVITAKRDDVVKVEVKKPTGDWKKVSEVKLAEPATHARITSPKVALPAEMKVHEGPMQTTKTDKPAPQPVGTVTEVRSENGNPVQKVALECPNTENLRLGPNAKYRDVIIAAGKRSGFTPQSIAAIMNAEAATITNVTYIPVIDRKTKKPALGKDGKPKTKKLTENTGEWDPRSASSKSSARGMTQFLDASWVDMALNDGTFLNERAKKEGWITTQKSTVIKKKQPVEVETPAFKRADGKLVTKTKDTALVRILSSKPYITGRATASDANLQKLLDLRYVAEYAINTAVDYGLQNLKGLKDDDFKLDGLSDGDKAKLIYLTHHLGLSDAKKFIRNTITSDTAKVLLTAQVGADRAAEYAADNGNDYVKGHRSWLLNFVDKKINITEKMCDSSKAAAVRSLLDVTVAIK
jgi:LysM repeat protein